MILPAITARGVQKHDVLSSFARLLIEDLAFAPQRRCDIHITSDNAVLVGLVLLVCWGWACEGIVQEFQGTTPDMSPTSEGILGL